MTPAEQLRRAAETLREMAGATNGTEWSHEWVSMEYDNDPHWMVDHEMGRAKGYQIPEVAMAHREADAAFIALMDPTTALLLADWLDSAAYEAELVGADRFALALAEHINGRTHG